MFVCLFICLSVCLFVCYYSKVIFLLYFQRWMYFDLTNFLEVSTYVTTLITVLPANASIDNQRQWAFGIIALLLAFVAMLLQLQL